MLDRIKKMYPECLQQLNQDDIDRISQKTTTTTTTTHVDLVERTTTFNPMVLQDPTEMYRRDPCDSIRHDFGHQPAYAIDDPSASELDDAFSVEHEPGSTPPSTWIHVHVADPTSILPPSHEMSRLAAERIQSSYLPERTWPMFPRALTEGVLSLNDDGHPKKVMTFSARMSDDSGEIIEFKIRPGLIRKIVTLNYDDVDKVLSWDRVHGGEAEGTRIRNSIVSVPEERVVERKYYRAVTGSVNTEDKEKLLTLQIIAQKHLDYRRSHGAFNYTLGRPLVEITPSLQSIADDEMRLAPVDYSCSQWPKPHISCRLDPTFASPARMMVAEYMIVAGRVSALFSRDHNLPTLFRNQPLPAAEKHKLLFDEMISKKTDPKTGMTDLVDMLPLRPYVTGAEISTTSLGHWSLGLQVGYCRVTSPLRRYSDMLAHWQLKGILLSKHNQSSSSSVSTFTVPPVFGLDVLVPLSGVIRDRERKLGMLEARTVRFWIIEMFRRRAEAGLSNIFEGIVINPTADGYNVLSTLLGFQTVVKAQPQEIPEIGTKVLFELNNYNPQ
ncbi:hypothetical protein BGZ65_004810, partial [Modicella reniformis]